MLTIEEACQGFSAVGSEPRMGVLLAIIEAGEAGLLFREVAERTGIPASTLSHHLRFLAAARLIVQERNGRETVNRPNFEQLEQLSSFILATCCAAGPGHAHPYHPAEERKKSPTGGALAPSVGSSFTDKAEPDNE